MNIDTEEKAAEIRERAIDRGDLTIISNMEKEQFFLTIDHCQRYSDISERSRIMEDNGWVPVTCHIPMYVKPRASVPDGVIRTKEEYISVFYYDYTEIPNPNPLYQGVFPTFYNETRGRIVE